MLNADGLAAVLKARCAEVARHLGALAQAAQPAARAGDRAGGG